MITSMTYGGTDIVHDVETWAAVANRALPSGSQQVQTVQPLRAQWAVHHARKNAATRLSVTLTTHHADQADAFAELHDYFAQLITAVPQGDLVIVNDGVQRTYPDAVLESYEPEGRGLTNVLVLTFRAGASEETENITVNGELIQITL